MSKLTLLLTEREREMLIAAIDDAVAHCNSQAFYEGAHGKRENAHRWNLMRREYQELLRKLEP